MRSILLVKTSSLGDVVHNLPVASDIRARFPGARIDWVVEEAFADIPRLHPGVRRVIPVAVRRWRRNLLAAATWGELREYRTAVRSERYDLVLDTQGLIKSALLARQVPGRRAGYAAEAAREPLAARFYDPKLHGVDWLAIKARYEPVVARCRTIEELYYYIWMAQGELSASHMGVFGRKSFTQQTATADLGAKLTPVQLSDGRTGLKVSDLESNGSLEKSWVREGDVIVGVDGKRFDARQNSYAALELFNHGYDFKLWVSADGTPENIREVVVKAEAANVATQRRYASLLSARAKTVSEKSRGRMGYIHLSAMDDANLQNFRNYIARPDVRKLDGLIIDARGNRGGLSYMDILDILVDAPYLQILPRTREEWQQPRLYWDKPVVVMCDERSNSGGECFPWAIKTLKRGLVVGEQSPGNVIGTSWEPLSDGSMIGIPTEGYFSMDRKTNLENFGVMPDIRVPLTPENRIKRQDPQLDAAIKALLDQLKAPAKGGSGSR